MTTPYIDERELDQDLPKPDEPEPTRDHAESRTFDYAMLRIVVLDLNEAGSGCMPFILSTADLSLEARRDLLIKSERSAARVRRLRRCRRMPDIRARARAC